MLKLNDKLKERFKFQYDNTLRDKQAQKNRIDPDLNSNMIIL